MKKQFPIDLLPVYQNLMKTGPRKSIWVITAVVTTIFLGLSIYLQFYYPKSSSARRKDSLDAVMAYGATVRLDWDRRSWISKHIPGFSHFHIPVGDVQFGGLKKIGDTEISEILGITEMEVLELHYTSVTDLGIEQIVNAKLPRLRAINLTGTMITDKGLIALASIPSLTDISLSHCPEITSAGMERFRKECDHFIRVHR